MAQTDYVLCMSSFNKENDEDRVKKVINIVLSKRLAACVSIIPHIHSHYHWRDKIEHSEEVILLFKTKASLVEKLKKEVLVNHSYEIPEFVVLPIADGGLHYFSWIDREVRES